MAGARRGDGRFDDARMFDRTGARDRPELWSDTSDLGMVSCAHYLATKAGVGVLSDGGNAIDAACATSLALAVVEPAASGLGGMAMMTVHLAGGEDGGRTFVLPAPCRAPVRATPEAVARAGRYFGYRAVAVPTYVAALETLHSRYGTLPMERLLGPATEYAETGYRITNTQSSLIRRYGSGLSLGAPALGGADGLGLAAGALFRQPELAETLRRLARDGLRDFYEGNIARSIARDMERHGGFVSADDLAATGMFREEEPRKTTFRGGTLFVPGPPAGGKTLIEMINLFNELAGASFDPGSPDGVELLAAVIRRARRDRRRYRLERDEDPDYAGPEHARRVARRLRARLRGGETSHLCVMDRLGNAVSLTQSIERSFGAKVATPGLGFLYNGYMKGFKIQARRHPHFLRPGAVARSNAAPTILVASGRPRVLVGSTGSERMASGIFLVLVRLSGPSPFEAVHAPRLHVTPQSQVLAESERFAPKCLERLRERGYRLEASEPFSFKFGGLHLATFDGRVFRGAADPRRDGAAAGPPGPDRAGA